MTLMELREEANDAFAEHLGSFALNRHSNLQAAHEAYLLDPRTVRFLDNLRLRGYGRFALGHGALGDGNLFRDKWEAS